MPTAVEYGLITSWHDATAIEYGVNPANASTAIEYGLVNSGNPWHGQSPLADGYTWSNVWHTQGKVEVMMAPPVPAAEDWQLTGVVAAALLVLVAIAIAVRRRFASR